MNVKKIVAATPKEALRLLREDLGPDAVILSNKSTEEGIEILAVGSGDLEALATPGEKRVVDASLADDLRRVEAAEPARVLSVPGDLSQVMREEFATLRGILEAQLAEISWDASTQKNPERATVMKEMLSAGFGAGLSRYLISRMPAMKTPEDGMRWVRESLSKNMVALDNDDAMLDAGGIFALVGPTGVGKTTTTAKLAARCAMRNGAGKLALITTDGYRVGAYEQLRTYARILGVMVHAVKDESDLRIALQELKNKHTVLIDTVGMSQRDMMVAEQVAMLSGAGMEVKRILCLNATSNGDTLSEVVRSYVGQGLAGCILTKLDEAASVGAVLDVLIRHKLSLFYMANGQRVPEDILVANKEHILDLAFRKKPENGPFQIKESEVALVASSALSSSLDATLKEVRIG